MRTKYARSVRLIEDDRIGRRVESGPLVPWTGYYMYVGHKDGGDFDCFVSPQFESGMFFERGEKVPGIISCDHPVVWKITALLR